MKVYTGTFTATDADIDVSYYVLISDEPTSYVTYQGP
jgi:hypothetical protein